MTTQANLYNEKINSRLLSMLGEALNVKDKQFESLFYLISEYNAATIIEASYGFLTLLKPDWFKRNAIIITSVKTSTSEGFGLSFTNKDRGIIFTGETQVLSLIVQMNNVIPGDVLNIHSRIERIQNEAIHCAASN